VGFPDLNISHELATNHPRLYRFRLHDLILSAVASLFFSTLGHIALQQLPDGQVLIVIITSATVGMCFLFWEFSTESVPIIENALGYANALSSVETLLGLCVVAIPPTILLDAHHFGLLVGLSALALFAVFHATPRSFHLYFHIDDSNRKVDFCCWIGIILLYTLSGIVFGIYRAFLIVVPLCLVSLAVLIISSNRRMRTRASWSLGRYAGLLPIALVVGFIAAPLIVTAPSIYRDLAATIGRKSNILDEDMRNKELKPPLKFGQGEAGESDYGELLLPLLYTLLCLGAVAIWIDFVTHWCEKFRMLPLSNSS
jgi:hypothetical protein